MSFFLSIFIPLIYNKTNLKLVEKKTAKEGRLKNQIEFLCKLGEFKHTITSL